ncbi:MAG: ATP-binding cassette domain-containing protein [Bacteroidetes bacterium]|nr:ATP-binding cassette domain-containing protein [Bacteroidota bacterium]MBL6963678.1 ATP-binding cassette domain-containing protein [Bacteroidota bacterium]
MIEVDHVYKIFDGKEVLQDVSTSYDAGIINMIIGSSGSGKTVLLKCIVGLLHPDKGSVLYDNRNFTNMNYRDQKKVRLEIGMLFQGAALFNSMTVFENISFPLKMFSNKTPKEVQMRVESCLERVNLEMKVAELYPSEISGGMQKRVGIARAIVNQPKYLFYDEPNSGLDPKTSRVIDKLIKDITNDLNTTTIINSHDMKSVFEIADNVVFIHDGKKWWDGNPDEIDDSKNAELLQMMDASGREIQSD